MSKTTAFDDSKYFMDEIKEVFTKYKVDVNVEEDQHHAPYYTFVITRDGVSVEMSMDDICY